MLEGGDEVEEKKVTLVMSGSVPYFGWTSEIATCGLLQEGGGGWQQRRDE